RVVGRHAGGRRGAGAAEARDRDSRLDGLAGPSKLSAMPVPFSATHSPLLEPSAIPQGFTRLGSVRAAGAKPKFAKTAWSSVTRLVCAKLTERRSRLSKGSKALRRNSALALQPLPRFFVVTYPNICASSL